MQLAVDPTNPHCAVTQKAVFAAPEAERAARVVVGIPTVSRSEIVTETVRMIAAQTRLPDLVLVCVPDDQDAGEVARLNLPFPVKVLISAKGLTRQRNRILKALKEQDLLLFLDDDFLMAPNYLEEMQRVFDENPDVVLTTGTVIADGITGPGLDHVEGAKVLARGLAEPAGEGMTPAHTGYGCNTALRIGPILHHQLFFDERLPLYSWLEDVDFSNRIKHHGRMVRPASMRGVHLGTKTGRTPGIQLGYSQVANPFYLIHKGTISRKRARDLILRNIASNLRGTVRPVEWADYRGRLRGNLMALRDVILRCNDPERILSLG